MAAILLDFPNKLISYSLEKLSKIRRRARGTPELTDSEQSYTKNNGGLRGMRADTRKQSAKREETPAITPEVVRPNGGSQLGNKMATVALVGLGAALIEVELIPGILLGVAAMLAPDVVPRLGRVLRPMVKGTVRAGYAFVEKTREVVAEAGEHIDDIVAEVRSETEHGAAAPKRA